jgi:hypothetical protein
MSFFSTPLSQSSASIGSLAYVKVVGKFIGTQPTETGVVAEVEVLVGLQVVEGLQYSLH